MDDSFSEESDETKIARLKREIRCLKMRNEDLIDELTDSRGELNACNQIFHDISTLRKPFSQPPPEILHSIFERTIPPSFLISSSDSFLPNSLWCHVQEQKHAILNVCRTWYMVGLPFLYEVVSIRRIYQLSHLLRTLKYSSLSLKEMIQKVEVLCLTPDWYRQHLEYQLKGLFDICPRISSFSYASESPRCPLPPTIQLTALVVPNITHLELITYIEFDSLQNLLHLASPHVVSLSILSPPAPSDTAIVDTLFRRLEDLTLWERGGGVGPFIRSWKLPRLKRLTFDSDFGEVRLKKFCEVHGAGLQYLHFTRANYTLEGCWHTDLHYRPRLFPDLSESCPILQHIVVPLLAEPLIYKSVKWVDVWVSDRTLNEAQIVRNSLQSTALSANFNLPALKGVRLLPYSELEPRLNLPLLLPPTLVSTTSDSFAIRLSSDVIIRHDVGEIRWIKPACAGHLDEADLKAQKRNDALEEEIDEPNDTLEEDNDDSDSDSDGSFIPDDSDSEDGTDYSSDGSTDQDWDPITKELVVKDWMLMDGLDTDFLRLHDL
ncbi:hypothetical protein GALMADRAFT_132486 [Galerina marginata CBS 339.88]|uniref:F-box domain-containing protein n=1 Tax=Galerina marginata (strain CBS 339.88) TaxID=685588 RepID=A0A067U359_GALM3|nr:hypothetical protein GALMADRAFT_132486 [Galerina marginata CBS 339.88]